MKHLIPKGLLLPGGLGGGHELGAGGGGGTPRSGLVNTKNRKMRASMVEARGPHDEMIRKEREK